jgi:hypothetical protein
MTGTPPTKRNGNISFHVFTAVGAQIVGFRVVTPRRIQVDTSVQRNMLPPPSESLVAGKNPSLNLFYYESVPVPTFLD